jgi:Cysteine-rich CPCC
MDVDPSEPEFATNRRRADLTAADATPSSAARLTYRVDMILPPAARDARDRLDQALHRGDRRIGVITGGHARGVYLAILTGADEENAARAHALRLVTAALDELGLAELVPHLEVGAVVGRPVLAGGPHATDTAPSLDYRTTMLPDGRVLCAARSGPLDEWFAYTDDDQDRVMAGRSLLEAISELFELPWGKKDPWVGDAIEQLAGFPTSQGVRFPCPCCDCLTLTQAPPGTFATCEVCGWEDDNVQFRDPAYRGGANRVSLLQGRENYRRHGRSDPNRRGHRRPPLPHERPLST